MECAICLNSVRRTRHTKELDCKHVFHTTCFNEWVQRGGRTCPLCRDHITKTLYRISVKIENLESGNVETHVTERRIGAESELEGLERAEIVFGLDNLEELSEIIEGGFFGLRESDFDPLVLNTE